MTLKGLMHCSNCYRAYPEEGVPYRCPVCGGSYDLSGDIRFEPEKLDKSLSSIWRYRYTFNLPSGAPQISLGEGDTPLIWTSIPDRQAAMEVSTGQRVVGGIDQLQVPGEESGIKRNGKNERVALKLEYLNPTGSFKDRGTAVKVSFLCSRGVGSAVEDSSGNAGASFAAYAARAGIKARVYVPDYASGPKRAQIEAYGAQLVRILGPRSNASEAVRRAAEKGAVYASHAYLPLGMLGIATIAYELAEQLGQAPGTVIAPVGHGSLLLGVMRGFQALAKVGAIDRVPTPVGVQSRACAPLWALAAYGPAGLGWVGEGETLAEGIRIKHPARGDALFQLVEKLDGHFVAVDEEEIAPARDELARRGFYVEPTSAVVWAALYKVMGKVPEPIVLILTGSGYKAINQDDD